jgi:hypothetical protein
VSNLKLILVEVVCTPIPDVNVPSVRAQRLLRLANAWLRRRALGEGDSLHLIGEGVPTADEFRSALVPFGLDAATISVVDRQDDGTAAGGDPDVESVIEPWLKASHGTAIPLAVVPEKFRAAGYPDSMWWLGIECAEPDIGEWTECIAAAAPEPFRSQASSWDAVLYAAVGRLDREGTAVSEFRTGLAVASLARWLAGFSAVSGDRHFDFDYEGVHQNFGLDDFRLGFEAALHHGGALGDEFEAGDVQRLRGRASKELLRSGRYFDPQALCDFFGGSASLFFSMYSSIWPKLNLPCGNVFDELLSLRRTSFADIDHAWQFVDQDDWTPIDDSQ